MPLRPKRLRLKGWLEGESLRDQIKNSKSTEEILKNLYSYLTLIYGENNWKKESWFNIQKLVYAAIEYNQPMIAFPMLKYPTKNLKAVWDYEQRSWYLYAHMLANEYGWQLEYIAELEIDDAFGLLQEIFVDKQLKKEWEWNLSELTYSYDSQTKTSKHQEYPRPQWMLPEPKSIKPIKIRKSMLPVGLIIKDDDDYEAWQNDIKH